MTTINHEEIAIVTECREQLLAQLKANGLDPFTLYAWALARDLETEAAGGGISPFVLLNDETECRLDDAVSFERQLMEEVGKQLDGLGYQR